MRFDDSMVFVVLVIIGWLVLLIALPVVALALAGVLFASWVIREAIADRRHDE